MTIVDDEKTTPQIASEPNQPDNSSPSKSKYYSPNLRPLKLRKDMHESIIKWITGGLPPSSAAGMTGISAKTLDRWIMRGKQELMNREDTGIRTPGEEDYAKLYKAIMKAFSTDEARCVTSINKAIDGDWKAALAKLERRYPKNWSTKTHIIVEAEMSQLLQAMKDNLDEETYQRVLRSIRGPSDRPGTETADENED